MAISKDSQSLLKEALEISRNNTETEFISTGNIGFDLALTDGRGVPVGSSVLFYAPHGVGKTTLLGDVSRRLIKKHRAEGKPFKVLYLGVEQSKDLLRKVVTPECWDDFIYVHKPFCWRTVEIFYEAVLQKVKGYEDVKLIILDSINNVLSDQNTDKSVADGDFGTKARERSAFYPKYLPRCSEKGITSFYISQVRHNTEAGMFGDPHKAAVSDADLHNVEIIVKCGKKSDKKDGAKVEEKTVFGSAKKQVKYIMTLNSSCASCKNRFFQGTPSEILMVQGEGSDNTYALRKMLIAHDLIKESGAYYSISEELRALIPDLPDKNLKRVTINELIRQHIVELVDFLKQNDKYKLEVSEREMDPDEEDDEDEE